jgi:uncharacterized membrane protein YgcG
MWLIITGVIVGGGLIYWLKRRPKTFSYRGKDYTRHSDGSITYADGGFVAVGELGDVESYWEENHESSESSSSDSSDSGSSDSGGGGDGDGGGGD